MTVLLIQIYLVLICLKIVNYKIYLSKRISKLLISNIIVYIKLSFKV